MTAWPPRRILVPLDFSAPSRLALAYAVRIAEEMDASIDVLHAGTPIPSLPTTVGIPTATLGAANHMTELLREREKRGREQLLEEILPYTEGHEVALYWWDGDPASAVAKFATQQDSDLVVMGTHGRSGFGRALLGSVAERAMRLCDRPVLLVRDHSQAPGPEAVPTFPPKRVVAPTDFSEASRNGTEQALSFALKFGAAIDLVHAIPALSGVPIGPGELLEGGPREAVKDLLDARAAELRDAGATVQVHVRDGSEADSIVDVAKMTKADLICIASHGRGGVGRLVLGSVAERTTRLAPCPVLIVRRPAKD